MIEPSPPPAETIPILFRTVLDLAADLAWLGDGQKAVRIRSHADGHYLRPQALPVGLLWDCLAGCAGGPGASSPAAATADPNTIAPSASVVISPEAGDPASPGPLRSRLVCVWLRSATPQPVMGRASAAAPDGQFRYDIAPGCKSGACNVTLRVYRPFGHALCWRPSSSP